MSDQFRWERFPHHRDEPTGPMPVVGPTQPVPAVPPAGPRERAMARAHLAYLHQRRRARVRRRRWRKLRRLAGDILFVGLLALFVATILTLILVLGR